MRRAMQNVVRNMIKNNNNTALLLVDIGYYPFKDILTEYPTRAKNIGIFEPGTISLAAGLALSGIIPTVYGISPFIIQRSLEQLKLDFLYQELGGNFITTGASYDFSTLGYSHYCAEDVMTLKTLPGFEILTPGSALEFCSLFESCKYDGKPSYFRMTDFPNTNSFPVEFGKANIIRRGKDATVIVVAEQLDATIEACKDLDVTILYYTTLSPFDSETLQREFVGDKVFISSPFYKGTLFTDVIDSLNSKAIRIKSVEVPNVIIRSYGKKKEKDFDLGLDSNSIRESLISFIKE